MQYISTRDREQQFSAAQAISKGLADDGGLLTPVYLPKLPRRSLEELKDMSYQQRAVYIMKLFLDGVRCGGLRAGKIRHSRRGPGPRPG